MTENCANCGDKAVHWHHIVPKSLGGLDVQTNLAPLCAECHGKVHGKNFLNHKALQRAGVERAKAEGKYTGRKPTAMAESETVLSLYLDGLRVSDIVERTKVSRASVYRILQKNPSVKHERSYKNLRSLEP